MLKMNEEEQIIALSFIALLCVLLPFALQSNDSNVSSWLTLRMEIKDRRTKNTQILE